MQCWNGGKHIAANTGSCNHHPKPEPAPLLHNHADTFHEHLIWPGGIRAARLRRPGPQLPRPTKPGIVPLASRLKAHKQQLRLVVNMHSTAEGPTAVQKNQWGHYIAEDAGNGASVEHSMCIYWHGALGMHLLSLWLNALLVLSDG